MAADRPSGAASFPASDSPIGNIASLDNKVALITGASSGLGRAIALAYAAAGAYVVSADLTPDPTPAPIVEATQKELDHKTPTVELVNDRWPAQSDLKGKGQGPGKRAAYVKCDVTDESSVKNAVAFAVDTFGRLDIMVNNAGELPDLHLSIDPILDDAVDLCREDARQLLEAQGIRTCLD